MDKTFITASDLLQDSFRLAAQIHRSGFRPDFIIGIWRGGTPVGIAIQEYFEYVGVRPDHIAVRTSAYVGIGERAKTIRVHGLHYIIEEADADDSLLVVDDVFDSGHSIEALLAELTAKMRLNMPRQIRIATPWYKPGNNGTSLVPALLPARDRRLARLPARARRTDLRRDQGRQAGTRVRRRPAATPESLNEPGGASFGHTQWPRSTSSNRVACDFGCRRMVRRHADTLLQATR